MENKGGGADIMKVKSKEHHDWLDVEEGRVKDAS